MVILVALVALVSRRCGRGGSRHCRRRIWCRMALVTRVGMLILMAWVGGR